MEDEQLEQLPKWLGQHFSRIETLDILGKKQLLVRCERSKEDWYIVREIPRVYAYLPKRLPYFSYARGNDFFCKYKTQRTGSTVSSSSTGNDDSPLGPAAPVDETDKKLLPLGPAPADETYKKIFHMVFLIVVSLLPVNLILSDRNPSEELSLLFLYTVFVGLLTFIVTKLRQ
jgi:hypothetical protein